MGDVTKLKEIETELLQLGIKSEILKRLDSMYSMEDERVLARQALQVSDHGKTASTVKVNQGADEVTFF